ncbi:MAG: hypothetical protein E6J53_06055 [Chloroflexi bacterium]|nr:MAG: hypothetical protein E6J53_06055 [Chloroflexota bacterium]
MSTIADEISNQVKARQKTIERSIADIQSQIDQMDRETLQRAGMVVGAVVALSVAVGVGWVIYRRSRRRTLVERLQDAIPEAVRDLPDQVRERARKAL